LAFVGSPVKHLLLQNSARTEKKRQRDQNHFGVLNAESAFFTIATHGELDGLLRLSNWKKTQWDWHW
jgi:hypothetical protein